MMNKPLFTFLLTLISATLLVSCQSEEPEFGDEIIPDFPEPVALEGEPVLEGEYGLFHFATVDTFLVTVTQRDTVFQVYDRDQNHITGFGRQGSGPDEFDNGGQLPLIEDVRTDGEEVYVLIQDEARNELVEIDFTNSVAQEQIMTTKRKEFPDELSLIRNILYKDDGGYISINDDRPEQLLDSKSGWVKLDTNLENFTTFPMYNINTEPYDMIAEMNLSIWLPARSPERNKVAAVMRYAPKLEIRVADSDENREFLLDAEQPENPVEYEAFYEGEVTMYYKYMDATDKYIYLLKPAENTDYSMQVLEWDGTPKAQFTIPASYELARFTVDETRNLIYGLSYHHDKIFRLDYGDKL